MTAVDSRILERIENALGATRRFALLEALQPGIDPAYVRRTTDALGLPNLADLENLYRWRNGTRDDPTLMLGEIWLVPSAFFQSLEDAVVDYRTLVSDPRWHRNWFPVFADGGGDFYAVEVGGGNNGAVRHFRDSETEHPVEFESIGDMLETLAQGYERKALFTDTDGYLDLNRAEYAAIAAIVNPRVPWWSQQAPLRTHSTQPDVAPPS